MKPNFTALSAAERETIVNFSDADREVRIWTAQRTVITALQAKPDHFAEVASGFHGTTPWVEFTTVADRWSLATGAKRRGTPRHNAFGRQARPMIDVAASA